MNRAERMIGLAMKAGRLKSGGSMVEETIREGKAELVLIANDASDNTKKRICDKCRFYQVPNVLFSDMEHLGKAIGKDARGAVAVTDAGFAKEILKILQ